MNGRLVEIPFAKEEQQETAGASVVLTWNPQSVQNARFTGDELLFNEATGLNCGTRDRAGARLSFNNKITCLLKLLRLKSHAICNKKTLHVFSV